LHTQDKLLVRSERMASRCAGLGLILISMGFVLSDPKAFPFPWAMLSVVGALFVIAGAVSTATNKSVVGLVLNNPLIVYIGKMSYSLYLWHWPVFVLFRWTFGLEKPLPIVAAIGVTALTSYLSYQFVEKPVRRNPFVLSRPDWMVVSSGVAITCLSSFLMTHAVFWKQSLLSLSVTRDMRTWYPEPWPSSTGKANSTSPAFAGRRVFVLGDSHVWAYSTMLQKLSDEQGVIVRQYTKSGCTVANLLRVSKPECSQFTRESVSRITSEAAPGDVVFLASLRMNRLGDQWKTLNESDVVAEQQSDESAAQRANALKETDDLIAGFERASLTVMIDAPKPIFKSPPFRCSDWFNSTNPICSGGFRMDRSFLLSYRMPVMESLAKLNQVHARLSVWDPFPILCSTETCSAFDGSIPLFFDGDHLSAHGNRVLYPSFVSRLKSIWQPGTSEN